MIKKSIIILFILFSMKIFAHCDGCDVNTITNRHIHGCELPHDSFYFYEGTLLYNSNYNIGGFQFNVDGASVYNAHGGDAEKAGFTVSSSSSTVPRFFPLQEL